MGCFSHLRRDCNAFSEVTNVNWVRQEHETCNFWIICLGFMAYFSRFLRVARPFGVFWRVLESCPPRPNPSKWPNTRPKRREGGSLANTMTMTPPGWGIPLTWSFNLINCRYCFYFQTYLRTDTARYLHHYANISRWKSSIVTTMWYASSPRRSCNYNL